MGWLKRLFSFGSKRTYTTLEEYILSWMVERGLSEREAKSALAKYRKNEISRSLKGKWHDDVAGYSSKMLAIITVGINISK